MKIAKRTLAQDPEEGKRVDDPGRAEQQAEAGEAARVEQQERDAEHEEVRAELADGRAREARREGDRDQRAEQHDRERDDVVVGDEGRAQVQERPVVGRRLGRRRADVGHGA